MTDTPVQPPFPLPPGVPALPPGEPAGVPSIWQAALIFVAFGLVAGGACATFLQDPNSDRSSGLWATLFIGSVPLAAGAFTLLVFRLWRRRQREAWPSVAQAVLMGVAGAVLAGGGCGGWAMTMETSGVLIAIQVVLFALFVVGLMFAIGAGELFVISIFRLIVKRPGAR
jgi:hypothetical protein